MTAGSEGDEAAKTWASGRKLSAAERARKREVDRRTKAETRLREKQRVAELETKLADLTRKHTASQAHVSELLQAIEGLKIENERYRHELDSIRNTGSSYEGPSGDILSAGHTPAVSSATISETLDLHAVSEPETANTPGHLNAEAPIGDTRTPSPSFVGSPVESTIDPTELSLLSAGAKDANVISQRLILSARKVNSIPLSSICLDDIENQDALIRIGLSGAVGKSMSCPAWDRMVDTFEQCIQYCGTVERFVFLRLIHQMILFQISRRSGHVLALPDWYKPRPVQMRVPHEEIADYFAWPAFRERLVFSLSAISKDDFWLAFASNFQFCGPSLNLENVITLGADGRYSFVPAFENDMRNFKCWRMRLEFFEQFPDLYDFMVPLDPLPKQMPKKDFAEWKWPASSSDDDKKKLRSGRVTKAKGKAQLAQLPQNLHMRYILTSSSPGKD